MSGRIVRQFRARQAQLAKLALCDCGEWPHDFIKSCAFLASVVALEKSGWCATCGRRLIRRLFWDSQMSCVVRKTYCVHGCQHRMDWIRPEDATHAERDFLGLVESPERAREDPVTVEDAL